MSRIIRIVREWIRRSARRPVPATSFHERLERMIRTEDPITLRVSTVERSVAMNRGRRAVRNQE